MLVNQADLFRGSSEAPEAGPGGVGAVSTAADFADSIRGFRYAGKPTVEAERDGVPFFFNEFWTAGQRQGHSLHEVSYRACFKPQLPEFFISRLTVPGDAVYDPFMGRGTTPLRPRPPKPR